MSRAAHPHAGGAARNARLGLLTVSDSRTEADDRSGARARELIEREGHRVAHYRVVPDDPATVRAQVEAWLADPACDGVVVSGGTGVAPRDTTFEALGDLLDKRLDGFGELFRMLSFQEIGSAAMLSRAQAGVARGKPVFSLPGSPGAVTLAMERLILPELGHLLGLLDR